MNLRIRQYTKNSNFTENLVFPQLHLDFNINHELKVKLNARCDKVSFVYNGDTGEILKFENYIGNTLLNKNHPIVDYTFLYFNNESTNLIGTFQKTKKLVKLSDTIYVKIEEKEINPFSESLALYLKNMNGQKDYKEYSIYVTTYDKKLLNKYEFIDINNQIDPNFNLLETISKIIEEKKYFSKINLFISDFEVDGTIEYSNPYESSWLKFNNQSFSDIYIETCEIFEFHTRKDKNSINPEEIKCMDLRSNIYRDNVYSLIDMPFSEEKFYYSRIKELFYNELDKNL